jgi:hypothetical protein
LSFDISWSSALFPFYWNFFSKKGDI